MGPGALVLCAIGAALLFLVAPSVGLFLVIRHFGGKKS